MTDEKITDTWNSRFFFLRIYVYTEPEYESGRRRLDVECSTSLSVHTAYGSHPDSAGRWDTEGLDRDLPETGFVASLEYGRLRIVLCTAYPGLSLWRVLAGGILLADDDRGRRAVDTIVWKTNTDKEPDVLFSDSCRYLSDADTESGKSAGRKGSDGTASHCNCSIFLSVGKP